MKYQFILLISLCFLALQGSTQNLVQDPGFELTKTDYWEISAELQENMVHWRSPTMTSPDVLMRAKAVYNLLINKGITPNRLSFKGYGSKLPIADNTTKNGRAKNRRVEFKIEYQ